MQAQAEHDRRAPPTPQGGGGPETLRLWLLGGFKVSVGSRSIGEEEWHLRKAGSLLKLLALAPSHRLHREQAMELLWPDLDQEAALNNLHYALHIVRRTLEPTALASSSADTSRYLRLRSEQLTLCPDSPLWVDVEAFEEEAGATARHAPLEPAAFGAAIDLYAGELLPEDRYEPWVEERRSEQRELYLSLLLALGALYEERKEFELGIEALGRVVTEEPTHEGARVGLMRSYALSDEEEQGAPTLVPVPEHQPPHDEPTERLTAREREVALLVTRGLTNRRIAEELSISERTVENHIGKIFKKLGFSSRSQIAAWVAQR
jgi:DNA-binding SARP family transcriptional activator/DNA-binding CsgD family transcriptional regulator